MGRLQKGLLTHPNNIANGGGWSSVLVPVKASPGLALGIMAASTIGGFSMPIVKEGIKQAGGYSIGKVGTVSYQGGMARMTANIVGGGVDRIPQVANGNPQALYNLTEGLMNNGSGLNKIENYGATPKFVSALYGMR